MRALPLAVALALTACQREPADDQAREPRYLVQAEELVGWSLDAARVVVDVRPAASFAAGHVPGAVNLDIEELRAEVDGVPDQVAPPATVEAVLTRLGLELGDEVTVVDDSTSPHAARVVWTLQYFGHAPERLRVLDGGWPAWVAASGPESTEDGAAVAGDGPWLGAVRPELRVDAAWVLAHLGDPAVVLLDVRTEEEWNAGRIPGAVHIPWQRARASDGRLHPAAALRELYARELAAPTVAVYCKSGMRASLTWLVLRGLGHPDVRVYDGSWNEWGARPELPKEI